MIVFTSGEWTLRERRTAVVVGDNSERPNTDELQAVPPDIARVLDRMYAPRAANAWLHGHNSHLAGARPIDLLALGRTSDVLDALLAERGGAL